jgi:hypothetical protein
VIIEGYPSDGRKSKTFQVLMGEEHMKARTTQPHDYRGSPWATWARSAAMCLIINYLFVRYVVMSDN